MSILRDIKNEREDIEYLCNIIEEPVLQKRIRGSMDWYAEKAVKNKIRFYFLSFLTIVMPLLTELLNAWDGITEADAKNLISVSAMLTTLAASVLCLLKCQEKWILYRTTVERMKKALSLYCAEMIGKDELLRLVQELEDYMDNERTKWYEMKKQEKDNAGGNIV